MSWNPRESKGGRKVLMGRGPTTRAGGGWRERQVGVPRAGVKAQEVWWQERGVLSPRATMQAAASQAPKLTAMTRLCLWGFKNDVFELG